ncbi:MAG: hypothetical protein O2800_02215 [Planctomycetota bacterium]|nr:hypothetical protein [Planctomycetota bacterium]
MSVVGSKAKMQLAIKDLESKWARLREDWDDSARRGIEERYIAPLEDRCRQAILALEKVAEAQARARRECSEENS